jgi:hypothetical protein
MVKDSSRDEKARDSEKLIKGKWVKHAVSIDTWHLHDILNPWIEDGRVPPGMCIFVQNLGPGNMIVNRFNAEFKDAFRIPVTKPVDWSMATRLQQPDRPIYLFAIEGAKSLRYRVVIRPVDTTVPPEPEE